ncbi:MAG: RidA family protein [Deltaproteobacteria bacterium]|nr:RidA family protein [Deltaproteobacteria bacterium]MBW2307987.1 RidA family protein [Deltaproteobacteria bacterium]
MPKIPVVSENAPKAVGPYTQGIRAGDFLFISGQVAFNPETGKLVEGDITAQTHQTLKNIRAIVEAAGGTMDNIVKVNVYLTNIDEFKPFNETYAQYFGKTPPARCTVEVSRLIPGAVVEIEAIARFKS